LGSRSGLLGGWRDFFFRHCRRGFIPLTGQICRFPAEVHNWLSIKLDYYPSTTRESSALTNLTGLSSRPGHRGCWQCLQIHPRRVSPLAPLQPLPPPQRRQPVQCPPVLLRPPPLRRWGLRVLCSLDEQGAGAPAAPITLQQWGLGYDSQPAPPLCPTRLRRPPRQAPLAAPPAGKGRSDISK
jgi:hypothetical protein